MKQLFFFLLLTTIVISTKAQLVVKAKCDAFVIDVIDGKVNGLKPNARFIEIKEKFPCFTASEAEGSSAKCGASLSYTDRGVVFYTDRDYIEIKEKNQGKFTTPIMGAARNSLFKTLGNPKLKDDSWDAFETSYGTLVLHYNKAGKVNLIQMANRDTSQLSLCE